MNIDLAGLAELGFSQYFAAQLPLDTTGLAVARVVKVERSGIDLLGPEIDVQVPLLARWHQGLPEERPTVGDWLLVDADTRQPVRILDRTTQFQRRGADSGDVQLIAANVDTVLLVTACNREFNVARLERYLALVLDAGATPIVVLTKADLTDSPAPFVEQAAGLRAGLAVEVASGLDPSSLAPLRAWCTAGSTVALLGSSGVGKSTLLNGLAGVEVAHTQAARAADERGRHTTTNRSLHRLPNGAWILDSPGMRELGLVDVGDGVRATFDDIEKLGESCRFKDCGHGNEPGCAVRAAIEAGDLDEGRLDRYRKLEREERYATETIAERHARVRRFSRMVRVNAAVRRSGRE